MSGIAELERRVGELDDPAGSSSPADADLAPGYWDVETTFWLRWRFGSVRLEETVE
jgi:hypothetical protein